MGRTAKFPEDLLLDAVIKYSEIVKTKIKVKELARWSSNNINGLEGVKDYHFTRLQKDSKTGEYKKRLCAQRIEELNVVRNTRQRENKNVLLSTVNMNLFFEQDRRIQAKEVQEMRDIVSEYRRTINFLRQQNEYYRSLLKEISEKMGVFEVEIKEIMKKQRVLDKKVAEVRRCLNDENIRAQLELIGISDGNFDLVKYNEALKTGVSELFNIEKAIRMYQRNLSGDDGEEDYEEEVATKDDFLDVLLDF